MKPTLTIQALQQSALEFTNNLCDIANLYQMEKLMTKKSINQYGDFQTPIESI